MGPAIFLHRMQDGTGHADPFSQGPAGTRTMQVAHRHVQANWHAIADGDVVDVEFLAGERETPKISERF